MKQPEIRLKEVWNGHVCYRDITLTGKWRVVNTNETDYLWIEIERKKVLKRHQCRSLWQVITRHPPLEPIESITFYTQWAKPSDLVEVYENECSK